MMIPFNQTCISRGKRMLKNRFLYPTFLSALSTRPLPFDELELIKHISVTNGIIMKQTNDLLGILSKKCFLLQSCSQIDNKRIFYI